MSAEVVLNGIDTDRWREGPGGTRAVWSGRIVPEKAPHLAALAAIRAGIPIDIAGPRMDEDYFERELRPLLGPDVRHVGHLGSDALVDLVGRAAVAIVSPMWDEPYGLVAAEAMSCGTPVAAFDRGALGEIVVDGTGALAPAGDVGARAAAVTRARTADRAAVRRHAVTHLGVDRMISAYERVYERACVEVAA